jgi:uncharacterized protein (DUF169 family)
LGALDGHAERPVYHGVSYCDAVRRAGAGEVLRVLPGSMEVCCWAPVVLGLKEPDGRFEEGLAPRLAFPVTGLLLAPLDRFPGEPEAVLVHARPEVLRAMAQRLGREGLWDGHQGRLDRSALAYLLERQAPARPGLVQDVNRLLAVLARSGRWQAFTHHLFRSRLVTAGFDAVISRALADMSVCRNSTAIPLLTGRANVSFYCTGGITWGGNHPEHLTSGWPWLLYQQAITVKGQ